MQWRIDILERYMINATQKRLDNTKRKRMEEEEKEGKKNKMKGRDAVKTRGVLHAKEKKKNLE